MKQTLVWNALAIAHMYNSERDNTRGNARVVHIPNNNFFVGLELRQYEHAIVIQFHDATERIHDVPRVRASTGHGPEDIFKLHDHMLMCSEFSDWFSEYIDSGAYGGENTIPGTDYV